MKALRVFVDGADQPLGHRLAESLSQHGHQVAATGARGVACTTVPDPDLAKISEALGGAIDLMVLCALSAPIAGPSEDTWPSSSFAKLAETFDILNEYYGQTPAPRLDETGELTAQGCALVVLPQHPVEIQETAFATGLIAESLHSLTRRAAVLFGPKLRINALAPRRRPPQAWASYGPKELQESAVHDDLLACVNYLVCAKSVQGQLIAADLLQPDG